MTSIASEGRDGGHSSEEGNAHRPKGRDTRTHGDQHRPYKAVMVATKLSTQAGTSLSAGWVGGTKILLERKGGYGNLSFRVAPPPGGIGRKPKPSNPRSVTNTSWGPLSFPTLVTTCFFFFSAAPLL